MLTTHYEDMVLFMSTRHQWIFHQAIRPEMSCWEWKDTKRILNFYRLPNDIEKAKQIVLKTEELDGFLTWEEELRILGIPSENMAESELIRIAFKQVNDTWEIMAETNPELYYAVEHCINDHTSKTILKMKLMDPYGLELPEMNHIAINGGVALDKFVSRMIFGKEM